MISSDDLSGERSASQSVLFCILLLILGGLPAFVGIVSIAYLAVELVAWRFVHCHCHAVFESPHQRSRALIYLLHRLFTFRCCWPRLF